MKVKITRISLGLSPEKGSRSFGSKMVEIYEFEDITVKYRKKNGTKNNHLSKLPIFKEENKQSKLIANKSPLIYLYARYLREKEDHDEDSFDFFELHEKQVSGFLPSTKVYKSSSSFGSFLFSWNSSCNNYKYKNYDNIYYKCKCLLPFRIPVTDILICAGVVPYRDNIIFS